MHHIQYVPPNSCSAVVDIGRGTTIPSNSNSLVYGEIIDLLPTKNLCYYNVMKMNSGVCVCVCVCVCVATSTKIQ